MPVFVYNIQKYPSKYRLCEKCVIVDFSLNITYTTVLKLKQFSDCWFFFYWQNFTTFLTLKQSILLGSIFENEKFKNMNDLNFSGLIHCFKNSWISSSINKSALDLGFVWWVTSSVAFYEDKNIPWHHDLHVFSHFAGSVLIDCHINLCALTFFIMLDSGYFIH